MEILNSYVQEAAQYKNTIFVKEPRNEAENYTQEGKISVLKISNGAGNPLYFIICKN